MRMRWCIAALLLSVVAWVQTPSQSAPQAPANAAPATAAPANPAPDSEPEQPFDLTILAPQAPNDTIFANGFD